LLKSGRKISIIRRNSIGSNPVQCALNLAYDLVEGRRMLVDARRLYFLNPAPVQGTINVFGMILARFAFLLWRYLVDRLELPGWIEIIYLLGANPKKIIIGVLLSLSRCSTGYWDPFNLAEV
jgi:hypothetical protein